MEKVYPNIDDKILEYDKGQEDRLKEAKGSLITITTSVEEPTITVGNQWHKEID